MARDSGKILFGRYEMGRLLSVGTSGKVYYAHDLRSGESVAVKVLKKDLLAREPGLQPLVTREIAAMRLVRHPNVVELLEVMATKSRIFFVMEYAGGGGDLFERIALGRLPEDLARRYFRQLISVLDYCHGVGVFHRNLKLENLLLDDNGDLKVSEFGLCALREQIGRDGVLHTVTGSVAYIAPEILRRSGYDGAKADLWSCGVILYILLTGFLPFEDVDRVRMYRKILKAEYKVPSWISPEGRRLVSRLLDANPATRISISEVTQEEWFKKEHRRPALMPTVSESDEEEEDELACRPSFCSAFKFVSSVSALYLPRLIDGDRKLDGAVVISRSPAAAVMKRLEELGREMGMTVERSKRKYMVKMEKEGAWLAGTGRLTVAAEVYEMAPEVAMVEISKFSGDPREYSRWCNDIRRGINEVVRTRQGVGSEVNASRSR